MEKDKPKVLYVDDEEPNLIVFEARLKDYVDIRVASSGRDALKVMNQEEIPVVISDQVMPEMTGTELLAEVRSRHPYTVRMLMTAYTNFDDVVEAINTGQVTRFIRKPWNAEDVLASIVNAYRYYETAKENRLLSAQLLERERLSAVGHVAEGLVNELDSIAGTLESGRVLQARLQGPAARDFDRTLRGVDRLKSMVDRVRTYTLGGGGIELHTEKVNLDEFLPDLIPRIRTQPRITDLRELRFVSAGTAVRALIDPDKFEKAIRNIIWCAASACPAGSGKVDVLLSVESERAKITINDNGVRSKLPPAPVGMSLPPSFGENQDSVELAIARRIVRAHAGDIEQSDRTDGSGRTVIVDVPKI